MTIRIFKYLAVLRVTDEVFVALSISELSHCEAALRQELTIM